MLGARELGVGWLGEALERGSLPGVMPFLTSEWTGFNPFWPSSGRSWLETVVTCSRFVRTGPGYSRSGSRESAADKRIHAVTICSFHKSRIIIIIFVRGNYFFKVDVYHLRQSNYTTNKRFTGI